MEYAPVGTSAAAGAGLDCDIGILGAYALEGGFETAVIVDVKMALVVGGEILRAVVHNRSVGIPLDIVNTGIFGEECVDDIEYYILHFGIGEVEHKLCAAAALNCVAVGRFDNVFGMFLVELRYGVGHFGLNPYAETYAAFVGCVDEAVDAAGKFVRVYDPVAEARRVVVSWIFAAEPAVVHHEELAAHVGYVGHHLLHTILVNVEVNAFPAVEQHFAHVVAVGEAVVASPAVEVAARTAQTFFGVGERQRRGDESLAFGKIVLGVFLVDAGEELMIVGVVCVEHQLVVAAIFECCADYTAFVLTSFAVERHHHLGV